MGKPIFLDRDGVINKDLNRYVASWEEFEFIPGSLEAIKKLTEAGFDIFIISNQGGVGKGIMTEEAINKITDNMLSAIKKNSGAIKNIYYCLHKSDANCNCRKPKTGLIDMAVQENQIDLKKTYFIGDDLRDAQVCKQVGCKSILVFSGKTSQEDLKDWDLKPDFTALDLLEAVERIVLRN